MPYRFRTATIVALFLTPIAVCAQDIKDYDPLFSSQDTIEIEVEGPFQMLSRERSVEEQADGKVKFKGADGSPMELDVRIRARGNWRRNPDICTFPPMRFNFKKSQTKGTIFEKQDKLKVVTHCQNNSRSYDQAVISEYLAYRIFNALTDYSFRVRLVKMKYVYTDRSDTMDTYAVFIEHKSRLGKRVGGETIKVDRVSVSDLYPEDLNVASVFQYLLGNTDFSPIATPPEEDCCHNQVLFTSEDGPYRTIPYDFDQTGLVDAQHAAPSPRFGLKTVKVRLYRGRCVNNELLPQTIELFQQRRAEIEAVIESQPELLPSTRRNMLDYIDDFYDTIDKPKRVNSRIVKKCL